MSVLDDLSAEELLDRLAKRKAELLELEEKFQKRRLVVLGPALRDRIQKMDAEHKQDLEKVQGKIYTLEQKVKERVLEMQCSVKGAFLHAVYCPPRVSWDTTFLDGLSVAMPEIKKARKEGEPSVTIRRVAGAD